MLEVTNKYNMVLVFGLEFIYTLIHYTFKYFITFVHVC